MLKQIKEKKSTAGGTNSISAPATMSSSAPLGSETSHSAVNSTLESTVANVGASTCKSTSTTTTTVSTLVTEGLTPSVQHPTLPSSSARAGVVRARSAYLHAVDDSLPSPETPVANHLSDVNEIFHPEGVHHTAATNKTVYSAAAGPVSPGSISQSGDRASDYLDSYCSYDSSDLYVEHEVEMSDSVDMEFTPPMARSQSFPTAYGPKQYIPANQLFPLSSTTPRSWSAPPRQFYHFQRSRFQTSDTVSVRRICTKL